MRRQKYNLSNYRLLTAKMGGLYPIEVQEVLPGDTVDTSSSAFIRFSPMLAPVMHPITVRIHKFFVPNRILWGGWEDFITGGEDGDDTSTVPYIIVNDEGDFSLVDYLGHPVDSVNNSQVNALMVYAYNKIWNEYYRDQDLQEEVAVNNTAILNVNWRKDYQTAARPWPQKGPDVIIPLGDQAPVKGIGVGTNFTWNTTPAQFDETDGSSPWYNVWQWAKQTSAADAGPVIEAQDDGQAGNIPAIYADLSAATGLTVTALREYFARQRFAEARAQFGSRYTEYLAYLGVKSSDARLQRPEYIGGGKSTVSISEVLQTATDPTTPVGTLRGHGIGAVKSRRARKFMEEHGYLISLMSIVPKSVYVDGCDRHVLKRTREEYWQRELEHIGQQEVYNGEVKVQANATANKDTFGWNERYAEYRSTQSRVAGEFRQLLNFWHLGRTWETMPALNEDFVKCDPTRRIFAEQTQDPLWIAVNNRTVARRLVSRSTIGRVK